MQRAILEILAPHAAGMPLPSLAWAVAEAGELLDGDDLPVQIYKDIHRAAWGLARPRSALPRVVVSKEVVTTFKKFVAYYPDRTKRGKVRNLRREILPHIRAFVRTPEGHARIWKAVQTEDRVLQSLQDRKVSRIAAAWTDVEDALVRNLGRLRGVDRDRAFALLARGRSLFRKDDVVEARVGLLEALDRLRTALSGYPTLEAELDRFRSILPRRDIRRAQLKALLHSVAQLSAASSRPRMRDEFKRYLHNAGLIVPLRSEAGSTGSRTWRLDPEFEPVLDEVVLRDAMWTFDVLKLAS